ncbi:sirohydrochlorin chelatase [Zhengella sp. ZM62]|uniref:sirohydrochlorin chelatase n=1 Tax=Zhengella sedimenti TaxID=3390035 RepID=UPI003976A242
MLAAHGERGGAGDNARLRSICRQAAALLGGEATVRCGVLSGEPALESAVAGADACPVRVYPVFMSEGFFVREKLPSRLASAGVTARILPALGADPAFARACAARLRGLEGGAPEIVLVAAHGSTKDDRSRRATEAFARHLATALGIPVRCAFLEEEPLVEPAVRGLGGNAAIVSLFAGQGLHGADDMNAIIAEAGFPPARVLTPAADTGLVAQLAVEAFRQADGL